MAGTKRDIFEILKDIPMCFCTLCSHQEAYGHCYVCPCNNHVPEPEIADAAKLTATVAYLKKLIKDIAKLNRENEAR